MKCFRKTLHLSLSLSLAAPLIAQVFPTTKVIDNGRDDTRLNFVVLSEGYRATEFDKFARDTEAINTQLFRKTPFEEYADFFNVYKVEVPSNESGADNPADSIYVDTYFGMTFGFAGIDRLLYTNDARPVFRVLASNVPGYDEALVLVNSPKYGGAGGQFATASTHPASGEVAIHEYGHSFADLADEYAYGSARSEAPNLTADSDPSTVRWASWIGDGSVGIFDLELVNGRQYYRPHQSCLMQVLNKPYCAVCTEQVLEMIYRNVTPIASALPDVDTVAFTGTDLTFALETIRPIPNTLEVAWLLDGEPLDEVGDTLTLAGAQLVGAGPFRLTARVTDTTLLSRKYPEAIGGYVFESSWSITSDGVSSTPDSRATERTQRWFYRAYPNPTTGPLNLELFTTRPADVTLTVVNELGQRVLQQRLSLAPREHRPSVDLAGLPSGAYSVRLERNGDWAETFRVVKQ